MKRVMSVSLGSSKRDHSVETEFMGQKFLVERVGTDGDIEKAIELIRKYDGQVDAFALRLIFEQQPPVIPHATENFDEITLEENQCLTCHGPEKFKEKKAPKIGDSHFRNQQTGEIMKQVSSARHACVQCHVPQVDAAPLVENTFQTVPQTGAKKKQ